MPDFPYPYDPDKFVPPPDWRPAIRQHWLMFAILGSIGLCFAVIDFSFCWVGSNYPSGFWDLWMGLNLGAVGAQAGLLAIYAVLGSGRIWQRHLVAISLGLGCLTIWWLGYLVADGIYDNTVFPNRHPLEVFAAILVFPALFFACCAPLWIPRTLFRWRIESQVADLSGSKPPQLSIAGILIATSAASITLALVRLGVYFSAEYEEADWWLGTGIAAAFTAGIGLFTLLLSTWGVLRARNLVVGSVLTSIGLCVVSFGVIALASSLIGRWPDEWLDLVFVTASFIIFLLGPLIVCRFFQYRLVVGRQQPQTPVGFLEVGKNDKPELLAILPDRS